MAQLDAERGDRIKWLREQVLHLTQETMADKVGVTLRGYQEWEAGGGIRWENTKKLAEIAGVEPDWIMSGDRPATPDLTEDLDLDDLRADLAQMRSDLSQVLKSLDEFGQMLRQSLRPLGEAEAARRMPKPPPAPRPRKATAARPKKARKAS